MTVLILLYRFLIVAFMVFIKAIFSACDTAFTYLNKYKIEKESKKDSLSKKILYFIEDKTKFYGIIEVVITMIELLASAYASEAFVTTFSNYLETSLGWSSEGAIIFAIIIVTILLSYVLLIFGSILPKQIARNYPEKTAYTLINFLWFISKLNYPFEKLIKLSTKFFAKIFRIKDNPQEELTEKELKMMIYAGKSHGVIDNIEKSIALRSFNFNNILAKHIMIKIQNVDFLELNSSTQEILDNISYYNYTRIPIYTGTVNNVIGFCNIKDFIIDYAKTKSTKINLNAHIHEVLFANENDKISTIFKKLQSKKIMLSIITDDNNNVVGMITLEDILEKLVGKIYDEYETIN